MDKDNYMISVTRGGKVIDLYFSGDLSDLGTIRALHKDCEVEVIQLKEPRKAEPRDEPIGKKRKLSRNGRPWANRVQCVETGEIWSSVVECSKATGIPSWGIYKSVNKGCKAFGRYFVLLPPEEHNS